LNSSESKNATIERGELNRRPRTAHVSTLVPRACGIATFTRDLALGLKRTGVVSGNLFVAVEEDGVHREYDFRPITMVWQNDESSYDDAAGVVNQSGADLVHLQHEYGIYGGDWGEYVLRFAEALQRPLVVTFHTVMRNPAEGAVEVLQGLASLADAIVATVAPARDLLFKIYGVPKVKIRVIPHGSPESRTGQNEGAKVALGLQGRITVTTLGLINPGKGVEYGIQTIHHLASRYPNILYLIVGQTHPVVLKHHDEQYRESLKDLIRSLRLAPNIKFVDRYLSEAEKELYYRATDIYLAPYVGRDQVSSGTITEALAFGKSVVSTPTTFAQTALADGRGLLCDFNDPESMAERIQEILNNPSMRTNLEKNALDFSRKLTWDEVAKAYGKTYRKLLDGRTLGTA